MREILFRAKRKDNGEWVEGYLVVADNLIATENKLYIIESGAKYYLFGEFDPVTEVIPETVGQYTGLLDKNGKKIFEGDLLRNEKNICFSRSHIGKVVFEEGGFYGYCKVGVFSPEEFGYLKVIGNIHDNPELLEVNND